MGSPGVPGEPLRANGDRVGDVARGGDEADARLMWKPLLRGLPLPDGFGMPSMSSVSFDE